MAQVATYAQTRNGLGGIVKQDTSSNYFQATPKPIMLRQYYNCGYSIAEAINDIKDNSDEAGANRSFVYSGTKDGFPLMNIGDNGTGMTRKQLEESIQLGLSAGKKRSKTARGRFGIGLTSSIGAFQCRAEIFSKTSKGKLYKLVFDIEEMIKNDTWRLKTEPTTQKEMDYFLKHTGHKSTDENVSGTLIHLTNIRSYKDHKSKVKSLTKSIGQTFREDITSGKKHYVNNVLVEAIDPMGFQNPPVYKGVTYKSTFFSKLEYDNIKYYDKNGVQHEDGKMTITFYKLHDLDYDKKVTEALGYNAFNSGLYVMRQGREMVAAYKGPDTKKPLFPHNNQTARLRGEVTYELGTDYGMDNEVGTDFTKKQVRFSQNLIDHTYSDIKKVIAFFRQQYKVEQELRKGKTKTTKSTQFSESTLIKTASGARDLLTTPVNQKPVLEAGFPIEKFIDNGNDDLYEITKVSKGEQASPFESTLIPNGKAKIVLCFNTDHRLWKEFLNDDEMSQRSKFAILSLIASYCQSVWTNIPQPSEDYERKMRRVEGDIGKNLDILLQMKPKLFNLDD